MKTLDRGGPVTLPVWLTGTAPPEREATREYRLPDEGGGYVTAARLRCKGEDEIRQVRQMLVAVECAFAGARYDEALRFLAQLRTKADVFGETAKALESKRVARGAREAAGD